MMKILRQDLYLQCDSKEYTNSLTLEIPSLSVYIVCCAEQHLQTRGEQPVHIWELDKIVHTKETRLLFTNVKNKYSIKDGEVRKMFMPGARFNLGLVWVLKFSWETLRQGLCSTPEKSQGILNSLGQKPSKNHCFHETMCIAYTNGPPGLEVI